MDDRIDGLSMNIEQTERDKLRAVFPQCFVEGKLDIDKLLTMCGDYITDDFEKYEFKWKGKSECLQLAQKRSTGTLRPCIDESVNFDTSQNLYIEGDNLEVLKLLQTSYYRKVKMIYIDPPYNTGNDFVYADDFADPMARYKEITSQTTKSNPETMGRFHTNWLNMMYPRLRLAANLLRDDGVCFISIDDNEIDNTKKLCNEVFGEENFVAQIIVQTNPRGRTLDKYIAKTHEYIVVYTKSDLEDALYKIPKDEKAIAEYQKEDEKGKYRLLELRNRNPVFNRLTRPNLFYPFYANATTGKVSLAKTSVHNIEIYPLNSKDEDGCWTWGIEKARKEIDLLVCSQTGAGKWRVFRKDYLAGNSLSTKSKALWLENTMNHENGKETMGELFGKTPFDFPKSVDLIKKCVQIGSSPDEEDIVMDFFSGSATTAHAVMQLNAEDGGNRRFIMVQLPELCDEKSEAYKAGYKNICEIGKERIRRAGAKLLESGAQTTLDDGTAPPDIGFRVFKLDTSNLKIWDNTPIPNGEDALMELERRLRGMLDIINPDRSNMDVVYEVMLKLGQDLCEDILELDINGKNVYGVGADCTFIVCLAEHITPEDAEAMAEYAPGRIIFTDQCFDNATDKSNVKLTLRDKGITIKML